MPELGFRCQLECVDPPTPASQDTPALSCRTRPRCRAASLVTAGSTASFPAPHGLCRPPTALCLCPPQSQPGPRSARAKSKGGTSQPLRPPLLPAPVPTLCPGEGRLSVQLTQDHGFPEAGPWGTGWGGARTAGPRPPSSPQGRQALSVLKHAWRCFCETASPAFLFLL